MAKESSYLRYVLDEFLAEVTGITSRAMFGGYGIYKDGLIVAVIINDQLYFKVGESNQADYEATGSQPFIYKVNGKEMKMGYWEVPGEIMENSQEVGVWLEKSYQVSLSSKKK